ncbi:HAD family hydrolase [Streptomyces lancefieldiae]|uniref:HAD family hydrolase n=1 Tax=Streptomyces lancefieldiae TaxID=3075520 RepID=A0ABU3AYE0_9ACTN|nr:HAD family hydrolase [Streptomyces sp. DSM 40712]MDT0615207.1 HAD family hydrolase [Streptomyces sp. DSM 40712]
MSAASVRLVSLDVGYTLGEPSGTTLTQRLVELSPRPAREAKRIAQRILHAMNPSADTTGPQTVCAALGIAQSAFPHDHRPPAFALWPGAVEVVARIARNVPVVTLSNVSHWDERETDVAALLAPHLRAHHPSWQLGFAKPDPRAVETVARLHGHDPAEVLHVGDSLDYDVRGALAAGAQALWITPCPPSAEAVRLLAEYAGRVTVVPDLARAVRHIEQTLLPSTHTIRSTIP